MILFLYGWLTVGAIGTLTLVLFEWFFFSLEKKISPNITIFGKNYGVVDFFADVFFLCVAIVLAPVTLLFCIFVFVDIISLWKVVMRRSRVEALSEA